MSRKIFVLAVFCACLAQAPELLAQADQVSSEPQTKLEAFSASHGQVIIKGFSKVAEITGEYGASVDIDAKEFRNAATGKIERGLTVTVEESGRAERTNTSFVDLQEIPALIEGLDYITKVDKSATRLQSFEASYRTRGELVITVFDSSGKLSAVIKSGRIGKTTCFLEIAALEKVRNAIATALTLLQSLEPTAP